MRADTPDRIKMNKLEDRNATGEIRALFKGQLLAYLVGFYIFAFYMELHKRISFLEAIRFQFIFGAIIGLICLYKFFTEKKQAYDLNSVTKVVFGYLLLMAIYTMFSMDRETSLVVYIDRVLKFSLVSFFIYTATSKVEDLRVIIGFILLAWLKIASEGFIGWGTGSMMWENQGIQRLHGSTTMFRHPNSYSGFAVGCLVFSYFLLSAFRSKIIKYPLLILLTFSLVIVVTTGSRTGYVAVAMGATFLFFKMKKGRGKLLIIGITALIVGLNVVSEDYKHRFLSIFTGEEKEGQSSQARLEIIEDAFIVFAEHPMGVGIAAFPKVRMEMFGRFQDTHNLYLEILTNLGPLGLILFFIFISKLLSLVKNNIRQLDSIDVFNSLDKMFLTGISKAVIGFLLFRLLLGLFGMDMYEIYWWLSLGITLAVTKLIHQTNHQVR